MRIRLSTLAGALLLASPLAFAEVTFTPFATYRWFDSQTVERQAGNPQDADIEAKEGYGVSLGYRFTPAYGVEVHFARTETSTENTPGLPNADRDVTADRLSVDGYYAFNADSAFSPYVLLGAGMGKLKPDQGGSRVEDTIVNAGLGAFYRFNDKVALRMEAREMFNSDEDLNDAVAMLGLEFSAGAAAVAAATPAPEPEPAPVEQQAAPAATADADADDVSDSRDQCSGTPDGVKVDGKGCEKTLTEAINLELKVNFDSGKSVVKDEYKDEIAKAAALMKQYPSAHMEIQGHTDSSGRAAANDTLSQQRADAVRAVLVNEMGVKADNITAKGYGASQPIADNKTAEGRAQNRRVIAVVTAEAKKVIRKKK